MPPRSTTKRQKIIALFRGAQEAIGRDDLLKARVLLRHCLEIDQADSHSWLALARLEAGAGDVRLARQLFVRGRRACPGNVHLPHAQAVLEGKLGMHGRARLRFAQAARLEPANAYVCHAWGLMEEQLGRSATAARIYARGLRASASPEVCIAWAALEAQQGDIEKGLDVYTEAIDAGVRRTENLLVSWAGLEARSGRVEEAIPLLEEATRQWPASIKARLAMAELEAANGDLEAARYTMRDAPPARVAPDDDGVDDDYAFLPAMGEVGDL